MGTYGKNLNAVIDSLKKQIEIEKERHQKEIDTLQEKNNQILKEQKETFEKQHEEIHQTYEDDKDDLTREIDSLKEKCKVNDEQNETFQRRITESSKKHENQILEKGKV